MVSRDLDGLLATLKVRLRPGRWCVVSGVDLPAGVEVAATVTEPEGTSAVIAVEDAERLGERPDFVAAWLTLDVPSALDAVGLSAAVTTALAARGIACNLLAGFHHDHLLVPHDRADDAIAALEALAEASKP